MRQNKPFFSSLLLCASLSMLFSCAYVGPPPEPKEVKAQQRGALTFLRSLPPAPKRDHPVCKYSSSGLLNIAGEIIPYEQFSVTLKTLNRETFVSLLLPSQRQYLAIPTAGGLNNECVAYRFMKQKDYAFYWGKDRQQEKADKVVSALIVLGVNKM